MHSRPHGAPPIMIAVIQRVTQASVTVEEQTTAKIGKGLLVLLGIAKEDTEVDVDFMTNKIPSLRIFSDQHGHLNRSIQEIQGELLVVSQFTLLADTSKGRRPSFEDAAPPKTARLRYQEVVQKFKDLGLAVHEGSFGASMLISLDNDGPVTIILDSHASNTVNRVKRVQPVADT